MRQEMKRIDFLRQSLYGAIGLTTPKKFSKSDNVDVIQKNELPEELEFQLLKKDETFHPTYKEYKVNKNGQIKTEIIETYLLII